MTGVLDTIRGFGSVGDKKIFCAPDTVTGQQLLAMLRKYLADHPERLHFAASSLVADMYAEAFHCGSGTSTVEFGLYYTGLLRRQNEGCGGRSGGAQRE